MASKTFPTTGIVVALVVAVGSTYGLTYMAYQPQVEAYEEQVAVLESRLSEAESEIDSLEEDKAQLTRQLEQQVDLNKELKDDYDALKTTYQELAAKWNRTSTAIDRLNVDRAFLKQRLNQHIVITYTFEDEAALWLELRSAAAEVEPELIPMIDTLIEDYRELYNWIEKLPEGPIPAEEAGFLMFEGYSILWQILHEDLRKFDARWIEIIAEDIAELE
ncbi:MAG: hypothetical protein ACE5KU_01990 [Nitrososphaerales archaeon]